jgi:hypothetical protein
VRTAIATHGLLPKGLHLESLNIETGCVSISVSSGARRSRCPACGRDSSGVHSRYSRTVSDLPWPRHLGRARGPSEALLLRRGLLREEDLLREA